MSAADAIRSGLVRIAPGCCALRNFDFYGASRLLLGQRRQEDERADHDDEKDDENKGSRHGPGFCRPPKPLYSPF